MNRRRFMFDGRELIAFLEPRMRELLFKHTYQRKSRGGFPEKYGHYGPNLMYVEDPDAIMAMLAGTHRRRIQRWKNGVCLSVHEADSLATSLGVHPSAIWSNWWSTCPES